MHHLEAVDVGAINNIKPCSIQNKTSTLNQVQTTKYIVTAGNDVHRKANKNCAISSHKNSLEQPPNTATQNSGASALQALTSAALVLPGLLLSPSKASADDSVSMQYSYYKEGKRELYNVPNTREPIRADTFHLGSQFSLTDRINFAFDYTQDTWSGATPVTTSPLVAHGNNPVFANTPEGVTVVGASPIINSQMLMDHQLTPLAQNPITGEILGTQTQLVHVLSSASPETRRQADFGLAYEWDDATINVGGGLSLENDYNSYYGSMGGLWNIN